MVAQPAHRPPWPPTRPPLPPQPAPPWPGPEDLNFQQMQDLIQVQQRTIRFLLDSYNELLEMVEKQGEEFSATRTFDPGDKIPMGWWIAIDHPDTQKVAEATIHGHAVDYMGSTLFWSDGEAEAHSVTSVMVQPAQRTGT